MNKLMSFLKLQLASSLLHICGPYCVSFSCTLHISKLTFMHFKLVVSAKLHDTHHSYKWLTLLNIAPCSHLQNIFEALEALSVEWQFFRNQEWELKLESPSWDSCCSWNPKGHKLLPVRSITLWWTSFVGWQIFGESK